MLVRKLVHGMGFRYRLHSKHLPGKPDLVFSGQRKVIFVNGCFWHSHCNCTIAKVPTSNTEYWTGKLEQTRIPDKNNTVALKHFGWKVKTIWECELSEETALSRSILRFLKS